MTNQELMKNCEELMQKALKSFEGELTRVRTGRASINLLERVRVDYYGNPSPLNQVATLSTPDARTILIAPFEKSQIGNIERSIHKAELGISPVNDGNVIRLVIPALTEDRRKDIVKGLKKTVEDIKIAMRNIRRDTNESLKDLEKSKAISEDDNKRLQVEVQKITDKYSKMVDERFASKEKEVMSV